MAKPLIGIGSDVGATPPARREHAFSYTTYVEALRRAGAIPVIIPPQPENAVDVIDSLDGILLAGGEDCDPAVYGEEAHETVQPMDRRRQENDLSLARMARERNIPTLGICLGMQMMNVAGGGTLIQDIDSAVDTSIRHVSSPDDRARHGVTVDPGTELATLIGSGEFSVNSSHHQAVGRVGDGLRVTAKSPDGIVEAIEDPQHPFYVGVQWHPEDMPGEEAATRMFDAFVGAARHHAERKKKPSGKD